MVDIIPEWKYSENISAERQERLADPGSYEELVRRVVLEAQDIRAYAARGSDRGLTGCIQPVFTFELPNLGDALFNGPWGYRAQYFQSASLGIAANREMISAIAPKLLGAVNIESAPNLAKIDICASLAAASAKLWIRESLSINDAMSHLAVKRWADEAHEGVELARMGLQAPMATKFEVKGALLDGYGNEVVPTR